MTRRLASVPDAPRRAIAYVRVSKERDEMVSPEIQLTAIRDYCATHGMTVVEVLEDLDRTGRLWKRRKIEAAVASIEQGQADVIVVWRTSRVARNRKDWWIAADRVESVGGQILSATEPLDVTTPSGRLTRGMLVELAVYESEQIGASWREAHSHRTSRGLPHTTQPRYGYTYEGGAYLVDPKTGPVLAEMYRRYVAGDSFWAIARWLNESGIEPPRAQHRAPLTLWQTKRVTMLLDGGFGAARIRVRGDLAAGAHDPVITDTEWAAYLEARDRRRQPAARAREQSPFLLSGLVRCAVCDAPMHAGSYGRKSVARYRCTRFARPGGSPHDPGSDTGGGYIAAWKVDQAVTRWLTEVAGEVEQAADRELAADTRQQLRRHDADVLARQLLQVEQQLTRLTIGWAEQVIPEHAYITARDELAERRDRLAERHRQTTADAETRPPHLVAAQLLEQWDTLSVARRREILRTLIERVDVERTGGNHSHVVKVRPQWEASNGKG